ncbi:MAG: hypothetical protein MUF54_16325 [Polyangiaceae bacterium]|jgi:hypothetical protein|nr:hypothetical protein [Polyangiaceae bacterium]
MQQKLPAKKQVAEALLSQSASVFVHLDPRRARVVVPPHFRKQPHLVLEIGLNMAVPIPDLALDDDGITCTLSFSRNAVWCRLTWNSIFALVSCDQRGMVWPEDVPSEVAHKFGGPAAPAVQPKPQAAKPRLVESEPPPGGAEVPQSSGEGSKQAELAAVAGPQPAAEDQPEAEQHPHDQEPDMETSTGKKKRLPSYLRIVK